MNYTATLVGSVLGRVAERYAVSKWQTTRDNRNILRGVLAGVGTIVGLAKVARPTIPVPEWAALGATAFGGVELAEVLTGPEGIVAPTTAAPITGGQTHAMIQNIRKQVEQLRAENEALRNQLSAMRDAELVPTARPKPGYSAMRDEELVTPVSAMTSKDMEKAMGFI